MRKFTKALCTMLILIIVPDVVIAAAVVYYITIGTLTPGSPMFIDIDTPTLAETVSFFCIGLMVVVSLAYARSKLNA